MGCCNSKVKELNEDLERVRKERIARERTERERVARESEKTERERVARECAERERAETAERDRVANSKIILVKVTSPPPGCEIEINEAMTVRVFLEKVAPLLGLDKSSAPSLQAEFSEAILGHELELKGAGMCDESLCSVLGVEAAKANQTRAKAAAKANQTRAKAAAKANQTRAKAKNMDIVEAAKEGRIADVKLVLQHAPEKVNDQNVAVAHVYRNGLKEIEKGFYIKETFIPGINKIYGSTALHWAARNNSLEVAEALVAANASLDIQDTSGFTALQYAKQQKYAKLEMITLLTNRPEMIKWLRQGL